MMSTADAVAVIVGAVPPANLTPVKVAVVMFAADCVSFKINDFPAVAVGIVKVQGVDPVSVAVCTVPVVITKVCDAPTVPMATTVSVKPVITGVVIVGDVLNTTFTVPVEVVTPVPPEATGKAEPRVKELRCVIASTTLVALL